VETKSTRAENFEEYYKLTAIVQSYDSYCLTIKAWSVTASGAAIGVAFSQYKSIGIFIVAFALSLASWLTEVRFKLFQLGHMLRIKELESALQNNEPVASPRIFQAYQERGSRDIKAKRWKSVMFWPQVMLPHLFFLIVSFVTIVVEIVRALHR
jgi:hypothetical protein